MMYYAIEDEVIAGQQQTLHAEVTNNNIITGGAQKGTYTYTLAYESFLDQLSERYDYKTLHSKRSNKGAAKISDAKYILGFSTGHAGSTTVHHHLKEFCNTGKGGRSSIFKFEYNMNQLNKNYTANDPCKYVRETMIPALKKIRSHHDRFYDIGHFHNVYPNLECLALYLGPDADFVRIRRNRYDIARSFSARFETPCFRKDAIEVEIKNKAVTHHLDSGKLRPSLSYCPLNRVLSSGGKEMPDVAPVALQIEEWRWRLLNPFQKFLWMVDDLEVRWEFFQKKFPYSNFVELNWSSSEQLTNGMKALDEHFACDMNWDKEEEKNKKTKNHITHTADQRPCSEEIIADLDYRHVMDFDSNLRKKLFEDQAQLIHLKECIENETELQEIIVQEHFASVDEFNLEQED